MPLFGFLIILNTPCQSVISEFGSFISFFSQWEISFCLISCHAGFESSFFFFITEKEMEFDID